MDTYYMLEAGIHPYQMLPKQTLHERLDDETWQQFSDFIDEVLKEGETSFNFSELEKILSQVKKDTESIEFSDMKKALEIISAKLSLEPELITAIETQSPSLIRRSWNSIKKLYDFLMRAIKFLKDLVLKSFRFVWMSKTRLFMMLLVAIMGVVMIFGPTAQTFQKTPIEIEDDQGHPVILTKKADNPISAKKLELASNLAMEDVVEHVKKMPDTSHELIGEMLDFSKYPDGLVIYQTSGLDEPLDEMVENAGKRWHYCPKSGVILNKYDIRDLSYLYDLVGDVKSKSVDIERFERELPELVKLVQSRTFNRILNELEGGAQGHHYIFFISPGQIIKTMDGSVAPKDFDNIRKIQGKYVKTLGDGDTYSFGLLHSYKSSEQLKVFMKELQRKVGLIGG